MERLRLRMVLWKEDYLRHAPPGGGEEYFFLCQDFIHEIEAYLYPYVHRLIVTEHITRGEAAEFMDFCYSQVLEVAEYLGLDVDIPH